MKKAISLGIFSVAFLFATVFAVSPASAQTSSGILTVVTDNVGTPDNRIAISGSALMQKVAGFKFTAQNADFTVGSLKVKIPANAATSISSVIIKWRDVNGAWQDATQALALPAGSQLYGMATFTGLNAFIQKNTERNIDVYVDVSSIESGATSGAAITALLDADEGFRAVDSAGIVDTTLASSDVASNSITGKGTLYVRKSFPSLSAVALDTTTLQAGSNQSIGRVKITANAGGDIGWKRIVFTYNKSANITIGSPKLYNMASNTEIDGTFSNPVTGQLIFTSTNEEQIASGSSITYELRATVGGLGAGANNVAVSIDRVSTSAITSSSAVVATSVPIPSLTWTDRSASAVSGGNVHSLTTFDWTNDYLINTLPLTIGARSSDFGGEPVTPPVTPPTTDESALIAQLQALIAQLLEQLKAQGYEIDANGNLVKVEPTNPPVPVTPIDDGGLFCYNWEKNLSYGSEGPDVVALNEALSRENISERLQEDVSVFDELTAGHVTRFQTKYGITRTGVAGPITRAKLNGLYGCGSQTPSVTIISPNGGETYRVGDKMLIKWVSGNISADAKFGIGLSIITKEGSHYGKAQISRDAVNSGSFEWVIPTSMPEGSRYEVSIQGPNGVEEGRGALDYSDTNFTILGGSPVVVEVSPKAVSVGGKIHVTVDAKNSGVFDRIKSVSLSMYSLDGTSYIPSDFTYSVDTQGRWYGDYTVPISAKTGTWMIRQVGLFDSAGVMAYFNYPYDIDNTFTVTSSTSPATTVLTPNGGEMWVKGTTKTIQWQDSTQYPVCQEGMSCMSPVPKSYDIVLNGNSTCSGEICALGFPVHTIANSVYGFSYNWSVGEVLGVRGVSGIDGLVPDGTYRIEVCQTGTSICDLSDYFTITSSSTPPVGANLGAELLRETGDKAGQWYTFRDDGTKDWVWNVNLSLKSAKRIKAISIRHDSPNVSGEAWSTGSSQALLGKLLYPLVVTTSNGTQLNSTYDQLYSPTTSAPAYGDYTFQPGSHTLKLYGNTGRVPFDGGKIIVDFTDGTSVSSAISGSDYNPHNTVTPITPSLNVALDSSTPASQTVLAGTVGVEFATIRVTAGSVAVNNLNNIQVGSDSLNAGQILTNLKVFDGATQIGSTAGVLSNNGSYYFAWIPVSGVSIPAFTSKTFKVIADISTTASGSIRAGIAGWNFSGAGANVVPFGTAIYGNTLAIVSSVTPQPSVTVLSPNGGETYTAGQIVNVRYSATPSSHTMHISLLPATGLNVSGPILIQGVANTGNTTVTIPANTTPGSYFMHVAIIDPSTSSGPAASSRPFTITSSSTQPTRSLTVALDASTPSGSVIAGSTNIPLFTFKFINGASVNNLSGLIMSVYGVDQTKLSNINLFEGTTLVANGYYSSAAGGYAFTSPISLPVYTSKILTVRGDISASASGSITPTLGAIFHDYGSALSLSGLGFSGNTLVIATPTTPPAPVNTPVISSITSELAPEGTLVITGSNFSATENYVQISNTPVGPLQLGPVASTQNGTVITIVPTNMTAQTLSLGAHSVQIIRNPGYYVSNTVNTTFVSSTTVTPVPTPTPAPTTPTETVPTVAQPTLSASLSQVYADKVGMWSTFGPGVNSQGKQNDFVWNTTLTLGGSKTIKSIDINHNVGGEYWSTTNTGAYPLVVFANGSQVNTAYGQTLGTYGSGMTNLTIYGQFEYAYFSGGTMKVTFTDDTTVTATIPGVSTFSPGVPAQTAAALDAMSDILKRMLKTR